MNKTQEALKLALEALEDYVEEYGPHEKDSGAAYAITTIREALAEQPTQQQELDELTAQRDKLADILTRTANALKGQPAELSAHSWHDLPKVAQQLKAAQQQEPFCYHDGRNIVGKEFADHSDVFPLYTSPPPRKPWLGLTAKQRKTIAEANNMLVDDDLFDDIEAKLKEKNA